MVHFWHGNYTKKDHFDSGISLHIFVLTLRCDHTCKYCQVSRVNDSKKEFDITFNLIFLDPPYKEQKINLLLSLISESNILKKDGLIVLHRNKKQKDIIDIKHEILLEKVYGISKIFFIKL